MIVRQITLSTTPAQTINLYYESRSSAEQAPEVLGSDLLRQTDDFKQVIEYKSEMVAADIIVDVAEQARANGEVQIANMLAEQRFNDRVEKDPVIKTMATAKQNRKRAQEIMQNAQRVQPPPGLQT